MAKPEVWILVVFLMFLLFVQYCGAFDVVDMVNGVPRARRTMGSEPGELEAETVAFTPSHSRSPAASPRPANAGNAGNAGRDAQQSPESPPADSEVCLYLIVTETGAQLGAGTNSVISLDLRNWNDEYVRFYDLETGYRYNNFEKGCTDTFLMKGKCVPHICKMTLYTDDSGWFPSWFPNSVDVFVTPETASNVTIHQKWDIFEWLPTDNENHYLSRDHCNN